MSTKPKKMYVLDTNVLIHDPQSMFGFENTLVGIPAIVLEELDQLKKEPSDRGGNAREVIRHLDSFRDRGSLRDGIKLDNGSVLQVLFAGEVPERKIALLARNIGDNEILITALYMKSQGYDVTFVSKDINARVKADVLNINAEDYLKGRVAEYDLYKGWALEVVQANELKNEMPNILVDIAKDYKFEVNEFIE